MFSSEKITPAVEIIRRKNGEVPEAHRYNADELESRLYSLGLTTDDELVKMPWELLERIGIPHVWAKEIVAVFRGKTVSEVTQPAASSLPQTMVVRTEADLVKTIGIPELVQRYAANPVEYSAEADQIRARSGGKPCLIYQADGITIDIEKTTTVLEWMTRRKVNWGNSVRIRGEVNYLYGVGEMPGEVAPESPFRPGQAMLPDGTDPTFRISLDGVSQECLNLIQLALQTGEAKAAERHQAIGLRDKALLPNGFETLKERYPKAARLYVSQKASGNLSAMKVVCGASVEATAQE